MCSKVKLLLLLPDLNELQRLGKEARGKVNLPQEKSCRLLNPHEGLSIHSPLLL